MTDGRRKTGKDAGGDGPGLAILDRIEREADRVVADLARSRKDVLRLKARVLELEGHAPRMENGERLRALEAENRDLRLKLEKVERKTREMLKKLDVIREG